jgi:signal peptidase I
MREHDGYDDRGSSATARSTETSGVALGPRSSRRPAPRSRGRRAAPRRDASRKDPPGGTAAGCYAAEPGAVAAPGRPAPRRTASRRDPYRRGALGRELMVLVFGALAFAMLIRVVFVQAFFIPSESMEETLLVGDRVLVNKIVYDVRDVRRGDIVVFDGVDVFTRKPAEDNSGGPAERSLREVARWFGAPAGGGKDYIKRVIGLPGDRVTCCDEKDRITVNGIPLDEAAYLFPGDKPSAQKFDLVVPGDRLWVMGDHRSRSSDSRAHLGHPGGGTVPLDNVVGRAFVVVWPLDRARRLPVPDSFGSLDYGRE